MRRSGRLRRYAIHSLAAASLLLTCTVAWFWFRSYRLSEMLWVTHRALSHSLLIVTGRGECLFKIDTGTLSGPAHRSQWAYNASAPAAGFSSGNWLFWATTKERRTIAGIITWGRASYGSNASSGRGLSIMFPFWFLLLLSALATASFIWLEIRQHHRAQSDGTATCPACGYDLRATPDRCPECGTVVEFDPPTGTGELPPTMRNRKSKIDNQK